MYQAIKIKSLPNFLKSHVADFRNHKAVTHVQMQQLGHPENVRQNTVQSATYVIVLNLKDISALHIEVYETENDDFEYCLFLIREETFYGFGKNYYNHHNFDITSEKLLSSSELSEILKQIKKEVNASDIASKFFELTGSNFESRLSKEAYECLRTAHISKFNSLRENIHLVASGKYREERKKFDTDPQVISLKNEISIIDQKINELQKLRQERNATLTGLSKDLIVAKTELDKASSSLMEQLCIPQFKGLKTPLTRKA